MARSSRITLGGGDPRLEQLAAAWVYSQASQHTQQAYWADLGAFAQFCADRGAMVLEARAADVEDYRSRVEQSGASAATVARRLAALASFYRYAAADDPGAVNPVAAVARPVLAATSRTDVLDEAEISALLATASELGPKTAVLVCLLLLDGLKLGEVVGADVEHLTVDGGRGWLCLRRDDGGVQEIELDRRTVGALDSYVGSRSAGPVLLADGPKGSPARRLSRFGANYLLKRAASAARLPRTVSANTLRRTFVAAALNAGSHLRAVQHRLGHADSRTTRRLSHPPA